MAFLKITTTWSRVKRFEFSVLNSYGPHRLKVVSNCCQIRSIAALAYPQHTRQAEINASILSIVDPFRIINGAPEQPQETIFNPSRNRCVWRPKFRKFQLFVITSFDLLLVPQGNIYEDRKMPCAAFADACVRRNRLPEIIAFHPHLPGNQ